MIGVDALGIILDITYPDIIPESIFDVNQHYYITSNIIGSDFLDEGHDINYYIPFLLSLNYCNVITRPKSDIGTPKILDNPRKKILSTQKILKLNH